MIAGKSGRYHADPLFARFSILKIGDLYRQQLRVHAWRFWNSCLPEAQAAMLERISQTHDHGTRLARKGMFVSTRNHKQVGYRVPKEWETLSENLRDSASLGGFKKQSKKEFLEGYGRFSCGVAGCYVCGLGATQGVTARGSALVPHEMPEIGR